MKVIASTNGENNNQQAEPALAANEAHLRALLQVVIDGVINIDERGIIQLVNPAAERMFGYAAHEMIGQNVKILMPAPFQEEHDGYIARYLATGEKRIIGIGREVLGRHKSGTIFPIDLSVAEARFGDRRCFVGIVRDISERKRAEEARSRLAAIVESSDDAIIGKTLEGTILSWNAGAERIYGYSAAEILGCSIQLLVPKDRPEEIPTILGRIKRGERLSHFETVRVCKDGRHIDVSLSVSPIKDVMGSIIGASAITRDITEKKRAEQALRKSKEDLERVVAELQTKNDEVRATTQQLWQAAKLASVGELAAGIAHELNNPLATVSLRVESALTRTPANDPRRRALEIIGQETKRMGDLVANLLQFCRRGQDQCSTIDLRQELSKTVELIQHHLRKRLINVVQEFAPQTPIIYADRQKLRQVFLNLLTNASDAMPQGGTLTLRTAPAFLDNDRPAVLIEFVDTGVGIPAEHLEKVMEPFFTTKEEGKGTGLGLAICRRVVQEHHGILEIRSTVGQGTSVRVVLPLKNGKNVDCLRGTGLGK